VNVVNWLVIQSSAEFTSKRMPAPQPHSLSVGDSLASGIILVVPVLLIAGVGMRSVLLRVACRSFNRRSPREEDSVRVPSMLEAIAINVVGIVLELIANFVLAFLLKIVFDLLLFSAAPASPRKVIFSREYLLVFAGLSVPLTFCVMLATLSSWLQVPWRWASDILFIELGIALALAVAGVLVIWLLFAILVTMPHGAVH
jgi:hypothetical protein